jgi:poly-gamma-glutamate capsule biosynthesis protein CapA/YwtB (metallophosphatase superfamily)
MNSHPRSPGQGLFGRPALTVTIVLAIVASAGVGSVAFAKWDTGNRTSWREPGTVRPAPTATEAANAAGVRRITMSATGDIILSSAPGRLPPGGGQGFFDRVRDDLAADLVMGNLEQPLTEDTGSSKCGSPPSANCYAFRSPPSYAGHLKDAGFDLMNLANNHTRDFGAAGARNTRAALDEAGIAYTGNAGEITVAEAGGTTVAVVGFSAYEGANRLTDLAASRAVVEAAAGRADLVVVQAHMGAEGAVAQHVRPGNEDYYGENRGDPVRFSRAVIDAGADLVIGHGPHVLRGMEFYRGRLIAYSLGNFAGGGGTLNRAGALKHGGVLRVTLGADGSFVRGEFRSTTMNSAGLPDRDAGERGRQLVARLTAQDFGDSGATIADDGAIAPPA